MLALNAAQQDSWRYDVDFFRILSAAGIVWYHSGVSSGHEISYAGLVFFVILSVYFGGYAGNKRKAFLERVQRLLVPWVFWGGLYAASNIILGKPLLLCQSGEAIECLLVGPSLHLWYLPFMFAVLVTLDHLRKSMHILMFASLGAFLATLMLASFSLWRVYSLSLGAPWAQHLHALAGVFVGLFFCGLGVMQRKTQWTGVVIVLAAAAVAMPAAGVGLPYFVGILMTSFCLLTSFSNYFFSFGWGKLISSLAQCTFGVYLVHPFFLAVVRKLFFLGGAIAPVVAFSLSFLLIFAFRHFFPRLSARVT